MITYIQIKIVKGIQDALLREGFKNYLCTFCRKFYKGGGGGSAVLQVIIFEKMLKVLQMLQFIQK